jgi:hypothetical protein
MKNCKNLVFNFVVGFKVFLFLLSIAGFKVCLFLQSNKLDVQCIFIARKEGAKFQNHKLVGCLLLILLSNCEVHHKLFAKAAKTLKFEQHHPQ